MHRLLFEQAPRIPEGIAHLRKLEQLLAGEVAHHLRRLDLAIRVVGPFGGPGLGPDHFVPSPRCSWMTFCS
ncbi:hypothetical protein [Nocardia sp. NBC_01329]|uniref:hypothetical protein n=1 Tax=Nocardia sp. NBC_01329 TaxID=2903594 RepID=UPI003FA35646